MIPKRNLARNIKKALQQPSYAIGAFSKRFKSYITYHWGNGYSAPPETISLFLTYHCNLRCKMCGQWGMVGSSRDYSLESLKAHLSLEEIEGLLSDIESFKPNVTLFGGEPLLYKEWPEVVRMVKGRGMRCNIFTNGILLNENAEKMVELGVDEIIFSLDGPQDIHDEIRGAPGTYEKAMKGFKKVLDLKREKGFKKPLVNISTAIFETNYERLDEVVSSAEGMGASSITFHHLIFIGRETYERHDRIFQDYFSCSSHDWTGFIRDHPPKIIPDRLIEVLKRIKSKETALDLSVYPNLTDDEIVKYYTTFDFLPNSYRRRCLSPWMVAYVFPDGSVRPCQSLNFIIGNIKEAGFREIWNGKEALKFRGVLKKEGYFPVCPHCTEFYRF
jgi:MoaA/NifB/PqqE/SkfB family radical SAM enzyme